MKICEAAICECIGCSKTPPDNYVFGMVIDTIRPEWFRREVVRSIASGASITLVANKGKIKLFGFPIMDVKDNQ